MAQAAPFHPATADSVPKAPVSAPIPSAPASQPRTHGDELIADLFEAMHDLHFVQDAVEGGAFCLRMALDKLQARGGLVHLYDIDRREFVVTSARGPGMAPALLRRHPENDRLLSSAMSKRRAVLLTEAQLAASRLERYALVGGVKSAIVAPVMQAGRFLGAIEVFDPLDGAPFTDHEVNAMTYIGEQLAELVASRGVVTDPAHIQAAHAQAAR